MIGKGRESSSGSSRGGRVISEGRVGSGKRMGALKGEGRGMHEEGECMEELGTKGGGDEGEL